MLRVAINDLACSFIESHPIEAVQVLERLTDEELLTEVEDLGTEQLLCVLDDLSPRRACDLFDRLDRDRQLQLVIKGPPWFTLKIIKPLSSEVRNNLLETLPSTVRTDIEYLTSFPADSVAYLVDEAAETLRVDLSVGEAINQLRASPDYRENSIFVVDHESALIGRIFVKDLALSSDDDPILKYLESDVETVEIWESRKSFIERSGDSKEEIIPVIDERRKLLGVLRHDVIHEEAERDVIANVQTMVGGSKQENARSKVSESIRHRVPWLLVNLATTFLAASVIALFEGLIAKFTALAVLLPIVAGQSGNTGSQSMAVTIRSLALREIGLREWWFLAKKEFLVGVISGVSIALVCALAVFAWSQSFGLALIIAISMVTALSLACIAGALVPIMLARFGVDPATASSIILTTFTDVVGFLSFLGIALLLAFLL